MKCPECNNDMVPRNGKRRPFMGCRGFPNCRHTAPMVSTGPVDECDRKSALKAYNSFIAKKGWTESQGSRWLQQTMGLEWDTAKISLFDRKQCELLAAYIKLEETAGGESDIALAFKKAKEKKK